MSDDDVPKPTVNLRPLASENDTVRVQISRIVCATGVAVACLSERGLAQALPSDSTIVKAAILEASDKASDAQQLLRAASVSPGKSGRDQYRLALVASLIGSNRLADAQREVNRISLDTAVNKLELVRAAAFARAVIDGLRGDKQHAAVARTSLLKAYGNTAPPPTTAAILLVVAGLKDSAAAALGEIDNTPIAGVMNDQFTGGFRGLLAYRSGQCGAARASLERAPVQQGAIVQAVKAACAERDGEANLARALRDSVIRRGPAEVYQWPTVLARNVVNSGVRRAP